MNIETLASTAEVLARDHQHSLTEWEKTRERFGWVWRCTCRKCALPVSVTNAPVYGLPKIMGFPTEQPCRFAQKIGKSI